MNKSNHTPGPWIRVDQHPVSYTAVIVAPSGEICSLVGGYVHARLAEREANARLIAAAPELLEALEAILELEGEAVDCNLYGTGETERQVFNQARAAISKARGSK
jgi:hypothetical protein